MIGENVSKLYGLYVHNLTMGKLNNIDISIDATSRLLQEKPPFAYVYGDVIVLLPDNNLSYIIGGIFEKGGIIVDYIHPNQMYRLRDSMVVHYIYVNGVVDPSEVDQYIVDWEVSMGLTKDDVRNTRYVRTIFT